MPFLRIPPFPGAKVRQFSDGGDQSVADEEIGDLVDLLRNQRVGGTFWAAQPQLPDRYVLVRSPDLLVGASTIAPDLPIVAFNEDCDPWHVLSGAKAVVVGPADDIEPIAAILEVPIFAVDQSGRLTRRVVDTIAILRDALSPRAFLDPFTGRPASAREIIELCGFWRRLIDSNRDVANAIGFAFWKQQHVAPLLWSGQRPISFRRSAAGIKAGEPTAVWRARTSSQTLTALRSADVPTIEVEDGFLRSRGLGADCIPPLSITVDRLGAYFDPAQPSELELLLQNGNFAEDLLDRARRLREVIVDAGLGKYDRGPTDSGGRRDDRRHILVPGQVEDDRAVQSGGCGLVSNLDLLAKVRAAAPDAYILYKPHPDVLAGHRRGAIPERDCLGIADEIVADAPISGVIALVDEVHVNTSLAGFEALLRKKAVTTYGVPFYAGWGLTDDRGPVPKRRSANRTLDELVAATLLLYPRYLDPVTGLPCPAEVVVDRLSSGAASDNTGLTVTMRRLQGKLMRRLRSLVQ